MFLEVGVRFSLLVEFPPLLGGQEILLRKTEIVSVQLCTISLVSALQLHEKCETTPFLKNPSGSRTRERVFLRAPPSTKIG